MSNFPEIPAETFAAPTTCRVIRRGETYAGKQGFDLDARVPLP